MIWHITHRCHNRDFLLKFRKDRDRYRHWLWEARKRYGLILLNYITTSNHIHLIVYDDDGDSEVIENSMQLAHGRIAQEFNIRNRRLGAFWQDRYHATAVQSHQHLRRCMTYIDMNMVRAAVVSHPAQWPSAGYHEIQGPPTRYRLLDLEIAMQVLGMQNHADLKAWQNEAIEDALYTQQQREECWTTSGAVGDPPFLKQLAQRLGSRARYKNIIDLKEGSALKEYPGRYWVNSPSEMRT